MTDDIDKTLFARFLRQVDEAPAPDFADVLGRTKSMLRNVDSTRVSIRRGRSKRVLVSAAILGVALTATVSAVAIRYAGPSPALTYGVSALDQLPPVPVLPPSVAGQVSQSSAEVGITAEEATSRIRLLLPDTTQGGLYAFRGSGDAVCLIVESHTNACVTDNKMAGPGILWVVSGGYATETQELAAVVTDNVTSVTLVMGGSRTDMPIRNNAVFVDLPDTSQSGSAWLEVRYQDGSVRSIEV